MKINVASILALIGALIALIAVFMPWMAVGAGYFKVSVTGWGFITDNAGAAATAFATIVLVVTIIALLFAILSALDVKLADKKVVGIIMVLLGIVIAAMTYLAVFDQYAAVNNLIHDTSMLSYGIGMFMGIIGGVLVMVAGILGVTGIAGDE